MELTSKQRAQLRGMANGLDTIVQIGKDGIGDNLVQQANEALEARELIKCRVLESAMLTAREAEFSLPLGQGDQNGILSHRALDAQLPVGKVVLHFRNGHGILSSSQDSGTVNLAKGSSSCQRTTRPWARLRGTSIRRWFRLPRKWSS